MKQVLYICDCCFHYIDPEEVYTLDLPRNTYKNVKGGHQNRTISKIYDGVKIEETNLCYDCYKELVNMFNDYILE